MGRVETFLFDHAKHRPQAPALSDATGLDWSYAALGGAVLALADVLRAEGVQTGDRVALLSENCGPKIAALFAIWHCRAVAVPINARQTEAEVTRVLDHSEPKVVLATTSVSEPARAHAARLGAVSLSGAWGCLDLARLHADAAAETADIAALLYTTGTTGVPKGVMLSHDNLRFGGRSSAQLRHMTLEDRVYGVLPTTHVFGLSSVVMATIYTGAHVQLVPRFVVDGTFSALRDGITMFSGVPQMHAQLMAHARAQGLTTLGADRLRYVSSGAAPLDPTWKREAEAFYGVALQNGYGMTETTAGVATSKSAIGDPDISCGPPLPDVELRIEGARGETGEVWVRGPNLMRGYFRNPEDTAKVLGADGWLRTGDLGQLDAKGHLHILGRLKELIIRGGFNVYPPEIEAALNDHPEVVQAAVVGRRVEGDEEVIAFCEIAEGSGLDEAALHALLRTKLVGYKQPSKIVLTAKLPAAATGKILKHLLLETFADALD